ncbi:MAG TPA: large conductance mechanosensitive channel protein MscL [Candidatus Coproplasma avistercoris]|nr:large conductance mechanosensitive channel protein MscL [Candidatus Coproplasma avistercoris]
MKAIKKLWAEFKKFITRGNVIDLAVGVVIGAAFTAIVTSLTNDIIMPLINWAVGGEENGISSLCTVLKGVYIDDGMGNRVLDMENSLVINWGTLIQAVLDFILIAIVVFAIVKIINTIRDAGTKLGTKAGRDKELRKRAKKFVKQGMAADEARAKAEAELLAEEAPAPEEPPKPTTEELLAEIRDLLAANSKVSDGAQEEDK